MTPLEGKKLIICKQIGLKIENLGSKGEQPVVNYC